MITITYKINIFLLAIGNRGWNISRRRNNAIAFNVYHVSIFLLALNSLIVCPGANKKIAGEVAERIRVNFNQLEHQYDGEESVCFSISVGVAEYVYGDPENLKELVEKADKAMYTAKRTGKNRVEIWDPMMQIM